MITMANKYYKILREAGIDESVEAGVAWYPHAWNICRALAANTNTTPKRVAAVMAVTSPRARWMKNLAATIGIAQDAANGDFQPSYGVIRRNETKAIRIMTSRYYSNMITGPKVSAFYDAICGDKESVTVDTIMSKAAGYSENVTPSIREEVTQACWMLADVLGIAPRDAQAAVWVAYRGSAV